MLRITTPNSGDQPPIFVLEGKLAGEWVNELLRIARELAPNSNCVFDLEEVSYVDPLGEQALGWLKRLGARFATDTLYGKDLCKRLNLHRICRSRLKKSCGF